MEPDAQRLLIEGGDGQPLEDDSAQLGTCAGMKSGALIHFMMQDAAARRAARIAKTRSAIEAVYQRISAAERELPEMRRAEAARRAARRAACVAVVGLLIMAGSLNQLQSNRRTCRSRRCGRCTAT